MTKETGDKKNHWPPTRKKKRGEDTKEAYDKKGQKRENYLKKRKEKEKTNLWTFIGNYNMDHIIW